LASICREHLARTSHSLVILPSLDRVSYRVGSKFGAFKISILRSFIFASLGFVREIYENLHHSKHFRSIVATQFNFRYNIMHSTFEPYGLGLAVSAILASAASGRFSLSMMLSATVQNRLYALRVLVAPVNLLRVPGIYSYMYYIKSTL